jgi:hypothetical protein
VIAPIRHGQRLTRRKALTVTDNRFAGQSSCRVLGQHGADRLDPETVPVGVDVAEFYLSRRSSSAWAKNADAVFNISFARRSSATS